jgi:hypothetical protein
VAAPLAPTVYAAGQQDGQALGGDVYGDGWVGAVASASGDAPTGMQFYTSPTEGGTYTRRDLDETSIVTNPAALHYLWHSTRPTQFLNGPFADGATVWVKAKASNGDGTSGYSNAVSWVTEIDKAQVLADKFVAYAAYVDSLEGDYVPYDADHAYWSLLALAYMYHETRNATHLTYVGNQWDHLTSFTNADDLLVIPIDTPNFISRYRTSCAISSAYFAQRLLRDAGQTALADTMLSQCDAWAQAMLDHLPTQSCESEGMSWLQAEWQAAHSYSVGAVVAKVADNGHQYRCTTAGTSGGSEPVWPTGHGATVADNGIVWTEDTYVADMWPDRFSTASPYNVGEFNVFVHPNQMLITALVFACLYSDAGSAFHESATAEGVVDDLVRLVMPVLNWSTGQMPYREDTVYWPQATNYDTLYGAYSLFASYLVRYLLGEDYSARLNAYLAGGLSWLNGTYATEPDLSWHYVDNAVAYYCAMEAGCRQVACQLASVANPVEDVRWSTALNVPATDYVGEYDQYGIVENPDSAAYQARFLIWDAARAALLITSRTWTASLTINAGAASTGDNDVTLTIACVDQYGDPPDEMRLGEGDAAAAAPDSWGAWEAFAATKAYQLAAVADEVAHARGVGAEFRNV